MSAQDKVEGTGNDRPGETEATSEAGPDSWRERQRRQLRALRKSLVPAERQPLDAAIGANLAALLRGRGARCIGVYWPLPGEPDLRDWYGQLRDAGASLALPEVVATGQPLRFRHWHPGQRMGKDALGIPYPQEAAEVVPDTVVAPCVGFDVNGFRLGNGGGYYDRTLVTLPVRPFTIGVAYQCLMLHSIKPQPHDVPMDTVVTEQSVLPGTRNPRS